MSNEKKASKATKSVEGKTLGGNGTGTDEKQFLLQQVVQFLQHHLQYFLEAISQ